jgi:tetratricopeptide (TPR) repeat protein
VSIRKLVVAAFVVVAARAYAQDAATQQLLQEADKYYDQADYVRAASNYDRAIRSQPKDVPAAAYAKRASIFLFDKKYQDGLTWITDVAERVWPDDDLILEQKAVVLSRLEGKKKDAADIAERVVKRRDSYTLHILLGDYYYPQGATTADKTAAHYEAYLRNRPSDLSGGDGLVRVKLGFAYLHLGKFAESERTLDDALRSAGNDANIAANARKGLCAAYSGGRNYDRALTVCEKVLDDKRALRGDPSPYYNIGVAYLNRDRLDEAMRSADTFLGARPREAKGFVLRGLVYMKRNRLADAEVQLNQAEQLAPTDVEVARALGRLFLREKRAAKAVEKLQRAVAGRPSDAETVALLAEAYLADGQGQNAATQAERALKIPGQEKNVRLMGLAGEGYYVAGDLAKARDTLQRAMATAKSQSLPNDAHVRTLLVDTINRQAAVRFNADDFVTSEKLLLEARDIDPESTRTSFNLGLVAVQKGETDKAIKYLSAMLARTPNELLANRVIARAYLAQGNEAKAAEHYARAATEATARRNLAVLAEINTEWAPLLLKGGKVDEAVDRLEQAAQSARGQDFERATKRNLALAYFRRGYDRLRARRGADAVDDLENSVRDPGLLQGNEADTFTFALGLAYLDAGQQSRASAIFQSLAQKGKAGLPFLKPPFDAVGADFFAAYTMYRDPNPASRAKATTALEKLASRTSGALAAKVRDVLRSNWESVAYDAFTRGQVREADAALKKAGTLGTAERRVSVEHNQTVLDIDRNPAAAKGALARLTDRIPEALVNLGILADREGDAKGAFDYWSQAKNRGARSPKLDEWIDTKRRLFGF